MATIRSELTTQAPADEVWSAVRDIGALHTRLVPGFVVDTRLEPGARIVTFVNGVTLREPIVTLDDEARRLVWTAEGGRAQEREGVDVPGHVGLAFQVDAAGQRLQVHDAQARRIGKPQDGQGSAARAGVRARRERQHLERDGGRLATQPGQVADLPGQDAGAADRLVQGALAEHHADPLAPALHRLPAHGLCHHGVLPLLVGHVAGLGSGDGAGIFIGLQQVGYELRLVDHDLGGGRLHDHVVQVGVGHGVRVGMPPAVLAAAAGDGHQRELLARRHAVLGQQFTQFLGPDAALAGLDPADLGTVAFEDPGGVLERVAHVLPVPAQRTAHHTAPHGGISGHGSCLPAFFRAHLPGLSHLIENVAFWVVQWW